MDEKPIININEKKEEYKEYLKSNHWKNLRSKVIWPGKICEICQKVEAVHAHHRLYRNLYDVTPKDLIAVCQACHSQIHDWAYKGKLFHAADAKKIRKTFGYAKCRRNKKQEKINKEQNHQIRKEARRRKLYKRKACLGKKIVPKLESKFGDDRSKLVEIIGYFKDYSSLIGMEINAGQLSEIQRLLDT